MSRTAGYSLGKFGFGFLFGTVTHFWHVSFGIACFFWNSYTVLEDSLCVGVLPLSLSLYRVAERTLVFQDSSRKEKNVGVLGIGDSHAKTLDNQ